MIPIFEKAHQLDLTGTEEEILQYFESNLPASIYTSLNDLSASLYTSNGQYFRILHGKQRFYVTFRVV